jgi:hypothetical protein
MAATTLLFLLPENTIALPPIQEVELHLFISLSGHCGGLALLQPRHSRLLIGPISCRRPHPLGTTCRTRNTPRAS